MKWFFSNRKIVKQFHQKTVLIKIWEHLQQSVTHKIRNYSIYIRTLNNFFFIWAATLICIFIKSKIKLHTHYHCNCLLYFFDYRMDIKCLFSAIKLLVQNLILKKYVQRDTQQTFLQFLWSLIELYSFEIVDQGKIFAYARNYKFLNQYIETYICEGCMNEWRENLWKWFVGSSSMEW